ncbi:MAG TPA: inositol monophosphatase family protein [Methylococcaceae bacterium]|nr:inositol monophosphatase family protein [Methylococcaceae bacterium]
MDPMITIAVRAARAAGEIISRSMGRIDALTIGEKTRNDFVSEVDRLAEQEIIHILSKAYPHHAFLGEEGGLQGQRRGRDEFVWIIDPLDGTTNFLHGFPQFAVSIALKHRDKLERAVIYDPLKQELFTAVRGAGATLDNRRIRVTQRKSLKGALLGTGFPFKDQSYLDAYLGMFRDLVRDTAGIRRAGAAALDLAYVAAGRLDGFWELGLHPWDMAAGVLLIQEAGGMVSDIEGGEHYMETGHIIAGGAKLHQAMAELIRPHVAESLRFSPAARKSGAGRRGAEAPTPGSGRA